VILDPSDQNAALEFFQQASQNNYVRLSSLYSVKGKIDAKF
jgi:hypothetical protein